MQKLKLRRSLKETAIMQIKDRPQIDLEAEMRTKTIAHLIIDWLRKQFHGRRLRDQLIFYASVGILLHIYVVSASPQHGLASYLIGFVFGILSSIFLSHIEWNFFMLKRIHGNLYHEPVPRLIWRIPLILIMLLIPFLIPFLELDLDGKLFYQWVLIPSATLYPVSVLFILILLTQYESQHGPVYIAKERSKNDHS